jgi:hypothetical protein
MHYKGVEAWLEATPTITSSENSMLTYYNRWKRSVDEEGGGFRVFKTTVDLEAGTAHTTMYLEYLPPQKKIIELNKKAKPLLKPAAKKIMWDTSFVPMPAPETFNDYSDNLFHDFINTAES